MSIARFGRTLWRGVQKAIKTVPHPQSSNGYQNIKQYQIVSRTFDVQKIASQARKNGVVQYLQRNRKRIGLFSFVGFQMIDDEKENRCPDLSFLFRAFKGGFGTETVDTNENYHYPSKISDYDIMKRRGKPSSDGAVYNAEFKGEQVAIKMMFNVGNTSHASNEGKIMQKFEREYKVLGDFGDVQRLDKHRNIIKLLNVFVDDTVEMKDSLESYPYMMPKHLFADGMGRKKTLYLVMPQFTCSLRTFLKFNKDVSSKIRLNLLCQLCEGVSHLEKNLISHRDLKSDNILVKQPSCKGDVHELVIIDFGSCFDGRTSNFHLPFPSEYTDRGGNSALMAPEILNATPGFSKLLDYSKADAWAVGAISHEIFGYENPLYTKNMKLEIRSGNAMIDFIIQKLLTENPKERYSANTVSILLCLMYYDFPLEWYSSKKTTVSLTALSRWLLTVSYEAFCNRKKEKFQLFKTMIVRRTAEELMDSTTKFLCEF